MEKKLDPDNRSLVVVREGTSLVAISILVFALAGGFVAYLRARMDSIRPTALICGYATNSTWTLLPSLDAPPRGALGSLTRSASCWTKSERRRPRK